MRGVALGEIPCTPYRKSRLPERTEQAISTLEAEIQRLYPTVPNSRWVAYRLIEEDPSIISRFDKPELLDLARRVHIEIGENFHDQLTEAIYADAVSYLLRGRRASLRLGPSTTRRAAG